MGMIEVRLGPAQGLKQSVPYPFQVTYPAALGVQAGDHAHMSLRSKLADPEPIDQLSTENDRISITVNPDLSATLTVHLTAAASAAYPTVDRRTSKPLYRELKDQEADGLTDPGKYQVLPVVGTLLVLGRMGTAIDFTLLFEASATREGVGVP